jgi:hypothetical protein
MDLSKLPKLSNTHASEPATQDSPPPTPTAQSRVDYRAPGAYGSPGIGADVWFSAIVGLLLIGLGFTFARFAAAKITGHPFHTNVNWEVGPNAGNEVDYFDLEGFTAWTDMGVFLFGLVLLFEAATKAAASLRPGKFTRVLLQIALLLTLITLVLNLYVCIKLLGISTIPLLSGLAVAFAGWVIADEWRMLQRLKSQTP